MKRQRRGLCWTLLVFGLPALGLLGSCLHPIIPTHSYSAVWLWPEVCLQLQCQLSCMDMQARVQHLRSAHDASTSPAIIIAPSSLAREHHQSGPQVAVLAKVCSMQCGKPLPRLCADCPTEQHQHVHSSLQPCTLRLACQTGSPGASSFSGSAGGVGLADALHEVRASLCSTHAIPGRLCSGPATNMGGQDMVIRPPCQRYLSWGFGLLGAAWHVLQQVDTCCDFLEQRSSCVLPAHRAWGLSHAGARCSCSFGAGCDSCCMASLPCRAGAGQTPVPGLGTLGHRGSCAVSHWWLRLRLLLRCLALVQRVAMHVDAAPCSNGRVSSRGGFHVAVGSWPAVVKAC